MQTAWEGSARTMSSDPSVTVSHLDLEAARKRTRSSTPGTNTLEYKGSAAEAMAG